MYFPTSKTVREAYGRSAGTILRETGRIEAGDGFSGVNISGVIDRIIRDVGRFTERFAGDCLYEIKYIYQLTSSHRIEPGEDSIIVLGIRKDGVDGMGFLMSRLANDCLDRSTGYVNPERTYRKILAVRVTAEFAPGRACGPLPVESPEVAVELKDITTDFIRLAEGEEKWTYEQSGLERAAYLRGYVLNHRDAEEGGISDVASEQLLDFAEKYGDGQIPDIDF